jgi:hypothetical integral membrane protein (TIGR02206 family)
MVNALEGSAGMEAPHEAFRLFAPDHVAVLALLGLLGAIIFRFVRRGSDRAAAVVGRVLALTLLAYGIAIYCQKGIAGELSWEYSLPLELCHWVLISAVLALVYPSQLACEITYFWGAAGTLQAALTPDIAEGFPSWEFIQFFWSHGGILLAIVYLIGRGLRPERRSILRMMIALNVYAAVVGTIDAAFGWNYGYLCAKPLQTSILDFLGPWPWYLLGVEIVALVSFVLLDLPWKLVKS